MSTEEQATGAAPFPNRLDAKVIVSASATVLLGALTFVGQAFRVDWVELIFNHLFTACPAASVSLFFSGLALLVLHVCSAEKRRLVFLGRAMALIAAALPPFSVLSAIFSWFPQVTYHVRVLGLPAVSGLTLGGLSVYFIKRKSRHAFSPHLAFWMGTIGVFGCLYHLYSPEQGIPLEGWPAIGLHTSMGLLTLSVGALSARPGRGPFALLWDSGPAGVVARRVFLPLVLAPIILAWIFLEGVRSGWFSAAYGAAIVVTTFILVVGIFVKWCIGKLAAVAEEQQRVEAALRASQETARSRLAEIESTYQSAPIGLCVLDKELRYVRVNDKLAEMLRISSADYVGRSVQEVVPSMASRLLPALQKVVETGDAVLNYEMSGRLRDDDRAQMRHWIAHFLPLKGADGTVTGVNVVAEEVTARFEAQNALRSSERRYRAMTESIPHFVWTGDPEGRTEFCNRHTLQYLGRSMEDMLGYAWVECVHPEDREGTLMAWQAAKLEKREFKVEFRMRRYDKRYFWFVNHAVPLLGESGEVIRWFGTVTNIHDRKTAEKKVIELNASLRKRAEELTAANRELEAFAYSASHDLRAPVRTIISLTELFLEDYTKKVDQKGRDYLKRVLSASEKMKQLIEDMLQLSQITRAEMERREVDLTAMASEIVDDLKLQYPNRKVECRIAGDLGAVVDERLFYHALHNLFSNAWKFTQYEKHAYVEFGCEKQGEERVFFVKDNGAGFDMEFSSELFLPFRRLHPDREFQGTGVGLAIVERVIERHGGRIWADSAESRGATFFFTLPAPNDSDILQQS